jgi:PAS domain S-box-containing protein
MLRPRRGRHRAVAAFADTVCDDRMQVFDALFEQARDPLLMCDEAGRIVDANAAARTMLGYNKAQLEALALGDLLVPGGQAPSGLAATDGETRLARRDGTPVEASMRVQPLRQQGRSLQVVNLRDLSERRRDEERLAHLANYDSVTGLPNRSLFRDRLAQAMQRARRSGVPMALMFLDLDRFKVVNDSLGHEVGDRPCSAGSVPAGTRAEQPCGSG